MNIVVSCFLLVFSFTLIGVITQKHFIPSLVMVIGLLAVQKFKASRPFGVLLILSYVLYVAAAYRGWFEEFQVL